MSDPVESWSSISIDDQDADAADQDRADRGLLRLELAAVVHGVAGALHDRIDLRPHLRDEIAEVVALGDVARDDGLALGVLAGDQVARPLGADVGDVARAARARRRARAG